MKTQQLGNAAEQAALDYLESNGLQCIDRNFSCKMGEIDLIMIDHSTLVFVEVRLRNNPHHGSGADSVTRTKMRKIIRTAEFYLTRNPIPENLDCRFDVISMDKKIDWIKSAFTLDSLN
ncbi:MAG: putative endonuclease [Candidatus Azotimanducaceae bacterium]|jgi:putative endonuclease